MDDFEGLLSTLHDDLKHPIVIDTEDSIIMTPKLNSNVDVQTERNTKSVISDLFYGVKVVTFKCLKCNHLIDTEAVSLKSITF